MEDNDYRQIAMLLGKTPKSNEITLKTLHIGFFVKTKIGGKHKLIVK